MRHHLKVIVSGLIVAPLMLALSLSHAEPPVQPADAIARVEDQFITFSEINTMMNSSAIVGLSMPALGTPERDTVRLTLLDKMISANLIYLDALKKGVDKEPAYRKDIEAFSDSVLASQYRKKVLLGDVKVSDQEVQAFYRESIAPGTEFTDDVRTGIEASLRNRKLKDMSDTIRNRLREGVDVSIDEKELDPDQDEVRGDTDVVATYAGNALLWGEVKGALGTPRNAGSMENRLKALNHIIDERIMKEKARQAGLENDPVYRARVTEYRKTSLITYYRHRLIQEMEPSEAEIKEYYAKHRERIAVKEVRKVQMVVLETQAQAEEVKQKIDSGEITIHQAAAEYSIVPDARQTLGEIGWVKKGSGFPELDTLTFSLGPGELGGPVESPAGWHLVLVLDLRDAALDDISDENTVEATRRLMLDERLDQYVVGLREDNFTVAIFEENLNRLAQQEADWYAKKVETSTVPPEKVKEQIEKLRK